MKSHRHSRDIRVVTEPRDGPEAGWHSWLPVLRHHMAVGARVNGLAVVPTTLFLFLLTGERSLDRFLDVAAVVFVLVNANFLILDVFYHSVWGPLATQRLRLATVLSLLALPLLGVAGAALGLGFLSVTGMPVPSRPEGVFVLNMVFTLGYGVVFFRLEDSRRSYRQTLQRLELVQSKQSQLEGERTDAEVRALQALVQPHFIFNALNSIAALIHDQPNRAEEATLGLARLMRHILETRDHGFVTLEAEIGIARAYLELEQVRMGERLRYEISLPESMADFRVPAMLLQPLVENAVKHGVRQRLADGGVWILVRDADGSCELQVIDNGPGVSSEAGTGSGLSLIGERLERLYGGSASVSLERDDSAAQTVVTLRLPPAAIAPEPRVDVAADERRAGLLRFTSRPVART